MKFRSHWSSRPPIAQGIRLNKKKVHQLVCHNESFAIRIRYKFSVQVERPSRIRVGLHSGEHSEALSVHDITGTLQSFAVA